MANRRFEMYEYRQVIMRMRSGHSDRDIGKSGLMGRKKAVAFREVAAREGWLDPESHWWTMRLWPLFLPRNPLGICVHLWLRPMRRRFASGTARALRGPPSTRPWSESTASRVVTPRSEDSSKASRGTTQGHSDPRVRAWRGGPGGLWQGPLDRQCPHG